MVVPLVADATGKDREGLVTFMALIAGVVVLTVLLACVNVATLMLARLRRRGRDLAIQASVGAAGRRLFRQVLLEATFLAGLAGGASLAVARTTVALLGRFELPGSIPVTRADLGIGARAFGMAAVFALATILCVGVWPAVRAARTRSLTALGGRSQRPGAGRATLLSTQVALSLVLVVGAALFGRTLREAFHTELGFDADSVAAVSVALRPHGYSSRTAPVFMEGVLDDLARQPGISGAAFALHVPIGPRRLKLPFEALDDGGGEAEGGMNLNVVSKDFFEVLGMRIVAGRGFDETDAPDGERVVVVNESAAARMWPGQDPIGRSVRLFPPWGRTSRVIGVVQDARYHDLVTDDVPYVFYPFGQETGVALDQASVLARSSRGAGEPCEPSGRPSSGGIAHFPSPMDDGSTGRSTGFWRPSDSAPPSSVSSARSPWSSRGSGSTGSPLRPSAPSAAPSGSAWRSAPARGRSCARC